MFGIFFYATISLLISDSSANVTADESSSSNHKADWMMGKWGFGFRMQGGPYYEDHVSNGVPIDGFPYPSDEFYEQITTGFSEYSKPSWIIVNLSSGAFGDQYTSPHSVLSLINDGSTPREHDHFNALATSFKAKGMKIIAYMASQGPAMFKHGGKKAYDGYAPTNGCTVHGNWCSPSIDNWYNYVQNSYGSTDKATMFRAYAEVIVGEYAAKFGNLIDGWWFDHAHPNYCNKQLIYDQIIKYHPDAVIAFNSAGYKTPHAVWSEGLGSFTAGHPNVIKTYPHYDDVNIPMITSIENSAKKPYINIRGIGNSPPSAGQEQYVSDENMVLGHNFMSTISNSWNKVWSPVGSGWTDTNKGEDWMGRVLSAGGAWTWNLPMASNNGMLVGNSGFSSKSWGLLDQTHVDYVKSVVNSLDLTPPPSSTFSPTNSSSPTSSPATSSGSPTSSPTFSPTKSTNPTSSPVTSSGSPTSSPTFSPTNSTSPTSSPATSSGSPTSSPTFSPTKSTSPTSSPVTSSESPTSAPTVSPTKSISPTSSPATSSRSPTSSPTVSPTNSSSPTSSPATSSGSPTSSPTFSPTNSTSPTFSPTTLPTISPTVTPVDCSVLKGWLCKKNKNTCNWEQATRTCYGKGGLPACSPAKNRKKCKLLKKINWKCIWLPQSGTCVELSCSDRKKWRCEKQKAHCKWERFSKTCLGKDVLPSCSIANKYWRCTKSTDFSGHCVWFKGECKEK